MSKNFKFKKLHIPKCTRGNLNNPSLSSSTTITTTTISSFFSQTNYTENKQNENEANISRSQPFENTKSSSILNEQSSNSSEQNDAENDKSSGCVSNKELENSSKNQEEKDIKSKESSKMSSENIPTKCKRSTVVQKFFNDSVNENDFEIPAKQQKKTFVSKLNEQKQKLISSKKRKRQPKINNMLLRDEMLVSRMIANQSIAENINPDEMQLALALSRSEIETNGGNADANENYENSNIDNSPISIRKKLKKYEFKSKNNRNTNDEFPFYIFSKSKQKWANKFTPLTLRNPDKQLQKLLKNIENILNQQEIQNVTSNETEVNLKEVINLTSSFLTDLVPNKNFIIRKNSLENEINDIRDYYVTDLFTPSNVRSGHLLRDFRKIPGRDLSPISNKKDNETEQNNLSNQTIQKFSYENPNDENNEARSPSPDLFADCDEMFAKEEIEDTSQNSDGKEEYGDNVNDVEDIQSYEKFSSDDDGKKLEIKIDLEKLNKTDDKDYRSLDENEKLITNDDGVIDLTTSDNNDAEYETEEYNIVKLNSTKACLSSEDEIKNSSKNNLLTNNENALNSIRSCNSDQLIDLKNLTLEENCVSTNSSSSSSSSLSPMRKIDETQSKAKNDSVVDDCIIILSDDDEVYDSARGIKNRIFDSNIDNKTGLSDDLRLTNESRCNVLSTEISKNLLRQSISHNFSLIDMISEDNQIDLEFEDNGENDIKYSTQDDNLNSEQEINEYHYDQDAKKKDKEVFDDSFFNLDKLKSEFGILNEKTPIKIKNEKKIIHHQMKNSPYRKSISESFLKPSTSYLNENKAISFQRSSSSRKFNEFIDEGLNEFDDFDEFDKMVYGSPIKQKDFNLKQPSGIKEDLNEFDEFDKMVYGSPIKQKDFGLKQPKGIENLLTGKINPTIDNEIEASSSSSSSSAMKIICDGKAYLVRTENIPEKPNYHLMDSPTLLKECYKCGLKPLKRKQAIVMLDYIYNQTHPVVTNDPTIDDVA